MGESGLIGSGRRDATTTTPYGGRGVEGATSAGVLKRLDRRLLARCEEHQKCRAQEALADGAHRQDGAVIEKPAGTGAFLLPCRVREFVPPQ